MKEMMKELVEILVAEISIQHKMLKKLEEQQATLANHELDKLEENLKDLENLRMEAKGLNENFLELKQRIARGLNVKKETFSLLEIASAIEKEERLRLMRLREDLIHAAKMVRAQCRSNMVLIRQSAEINHELMKWVLGKGQDPLSTYGQSGKVESSSAKGVVDAKV